MAGATDACGLWVATTQADFIYVDSATPPVLQRHTVLHELGHIVCGHHGAPDPAGTVATLDALDQSMVRRVLRRSSFDDEEEREAEVFADVAAEWLARWASATSAGGPGWR